VKAQNFLTEIKRRRVFPSHRRAGRVAVVYAGVAFIVFQIVDATFEPLHLFDGQGESVLSLLASAT